MEIANSWADGEDCIQRAQSDEEDDYGRRRERRSKRRSRVYEDRDGPDMVAAGYADRRNDNSRNSGGYRSGNFRDNGRPTQSWQRRDRDNGPSAFDKLSGPCTIHFYIDKQDGKKKASHMLKDCREFQKLSEGMVQMRQQAPIPAFGNAPAPGEIAHGAPPPPPIGGPNQPVAPAQNNAGVPYPPPKGALNMIQKGRPTNRVQKKITRQINLAVATPPAIPEYLSGSESCITFTRADHPCQIPRPGHAALVLEAQIGGFEMSRVFMDGGSGINLMFASTLAAMRIPQCSLEQSDTTFHGIVPGKGIFPLGKIGLDVIFGKPDNFRQERLEFEVVDWPSQYHAILGRVAFARFLAVPHYAYLLLKMPGPRGVITVHGSFTRSDQCDRDFNKISQSFGMQDELVRLREVTDNGLPPVTRQNAPDMSFDSTVNTKKVQVHPTDASKTALIANDLSTA